MHKYMLKWLMLFVFVFLPLCGYAQPSDADEVVSFFEPTLRVGLLVNQQSVQVSADANFDLVSSGTG
ncbi:MAG: SpoIID/LytB domain protein, partial [Sporomusa sp.]|nr:SpoIID/LytB domain protein [Sporomusa sp.]